CRWMGDTANFMSWDQIGQLHEMGFEIGNHTWSHVDFSLPENVARLEGEIGLVDLPLGWQGIPKPVSFAYTGNFFGPEAVKKIESLGFKYARRGMQPEVAYGEIVPGPMYEPSRHHPLLIPSAGDAYPGLDLTHFKKVVDRAGNGKIAVLQFHGVPDVVHDWVTTDPGVFRECMQYLKEEGFRVISMKELEEFIPENLPDDPMLSYRHSSQEEFEYKLPPEVRATRENLSAWAVNMFADHRYSIAEAKAVTGFPDKRLENLRDSVMMQTSKSKSLKRGVIKILPYPGGRHPRIGFLEGALDPMRGTKFTVFLPWDETQYIVVDLPEAIFSNLGLTFLAHRHIPTIWDNQFKIIDNMDWKVNADGSLENTWVLPNGISFGAVARPLEKEVQMDLWLANGTNQLLDSLNSQVCVMLKGADGFTQLDNLSKVLCPEAVAIKSIDSDQWIVASWEHTFNCWGNADVPCFHTDPKFPDCQPGDTVRLKGKLWFYKGNNIE
ncbi:MAG: polysaccharide deacetylase family protein, partial [Cyclobacteriaceae bacterium]|nr:polysaccharide deacetylase family protein [Cyclobacteriaceae bacterium]